MKVSNSYPDWVEKYRGKGRTIRKVRNGYGLYKCSSVYVPGQKYPKSVQEYLGMITEKDGFIPKESKGDSSKTRNYIEYGLSHFISVNFRKKLERAVYGSLTDELYMLAVIYYMFDSYDELFFRFTYIAKGNEEALNKRIKAGINDKRLKTIVGNLDKLIKKSIPDDNDRNTLLKLLMLCTVDENAVVINMNYPDIVNDIVRKYGLVL